MGKSWAELPAAASASAGYITKCHTAGGVRNYTMLYDPATYTAYWVAYPLIASYTGGTRSGKWAKNPDIDVASQINVWSGSYGVNYGTSGDIYARGHQIPDADRSGVSAMQTQTYYATNSTPQIQNGFNAGIWNQLEDGVRALIPQSDTLYVVTGATLRTVSGTESVTYITPQDDTGKRCPVPNYYYKVLMKCRRSGTTITAASAIGVWLPHASYSGTGAVWQSYVVSVDEIERRTGFNFFANLPQSVESAAEANSNLTTFSAF